MLFLLFLKLNVDRSMFLSLITGRDEEGSEIDVGTPMQASKIIN